MTLRTQTIALEGGPVRVFCAGEPDAPAVLLLHGGGVDRSLLSWRLLIPELARHFHVLAPDWPGYGQTPPHSDTGPGVPALAQWAFRLMDHFSLPTAHVAGVSMGGAAALAMALNAPERVDRLIPVGAYGFMPHWHVHPLTFAATHLGVHAVVGAAMRMHPTIARHFYANVFADRSLVDEAIGQEAYDAAIASGGMRAFRRFLRAEILPTKFATDMMADLHKVRHRTLMIHGEMDNLIPVKYAHEAAGRMENAELLVLPTGHAPMREAPAAFNAAVMEFLS